MNICNVCNFPVRPRQEGLQCEGCFRWQHRTCHTGISRAQYRAAVLSGEGIDWSCQVCMETPCFESTRMKEDMDSLINDPSMVSTCNVCVISFLGRNRLGVNIQNNCRNFADCGLRTADCGLRTADCILKKRAF